MNEYSISIEKQRLKFSAAHFTIFPDGTAERLHGHNYQVKIEIGTPPNAYGLVADFHEVKLVVDKICRELDEKTILPEKNPDLKITKKNGAVTAVHGKKRYTLPAEDVALLPIVNSTGECLSEYVALRAAKALKRKLGKNAMNWLKVSIAESPGQYGAFRIDF